MILKLILNTMAKSLLQEVLDSFSSNDHLQIKQLFSQLQKKFDSSSFIEDATSRYENGLLDRNVFAEQYIPATLRNKYIALRYECL